MSEQLAFDMAEVGLDVPQGYKRTEVGMIPEDWDCKKIQEISDVIRGASPRPKGDKRFYGGNVPRLMVEDVTRDGKYVTPIVDSLTEAGAKLSRPCQKGTLTIVCSGTVGIPSILAVDACIHDGFLGIVKLSKSTSVDYLYHFFSTQQEKFNNSATHGGVFTNLTTESVKNFEIAIPKSKSEQTAIATALSDIDALMNELEQLIAKKQAIKTATMQQLLTGRTRLPQFALREDGTSKGYKTSELGEIPEDWEVEKIGDNCQTYSGGTPSTSNKSFYGGSIRWITSSDLNKGIIHDVQGRITKDGLSYSSAKIVAPDTFLIALYGATAGVCAMTVVEAAINQAVLAVIPVSNNPKYLYYWFKKNQDKIIDTYTQGGQPNLSGDIIRSISLPTPCVAEQTAIATILTDMDSNISNLQQSLSKTRQIKQGMMQQLLTGRIRLI